MLLQAQQFYITDDDDEDDDADILYHCNLFVSLFDVSGLRNTFQETHFSGCFQI